ncbi:hypothetical protein AOE01nite_30550 [Acetobacter oeni]|uniref:Transposase IS204/IS1001/IS1096/IS1165 DDE domain-containing protein n=1 Tax=Acetobacter oeni TaxID=304077 RepID=A0A511XPF3_9PROT|nr:hypothetical protein AA21952_1601 [Acetobacter oeni LMG 21952]GEN64831.1 hypothetical protein AOE01nite_30550 [Acetobacter oeni]
MQLTNAEAELAAAIGWTKKMHQLLCKKSEADLALLMKESKTTMLSHFVTGLQRDVKAIMAALKTPWTTSPVEGQISKLKTIKRTMFGRASSQILRARILHAI